PPPPPPPPPPVDTGTLIVEVIVEGDPNFDFSTVTLTVEGTQDDGTALLRTLTNRESNVWTEADFPLGQYTAKAVVTDPQPMSGSEAATVRAGQTTQVQITLHPGAVIAKEFIIHFRFDNAFVEPCMRDVLRQAVGFATDHPDEKLVIVGHTDLVGSPADLTGPDPYNQSLSERRARSVFAFLTFGRDAAGALSEWEALRRTQTGLPTLQDNWGARQYQYMLQDLGFYPGNVDGDHGPATDDAVRSFRAAKGLPPGTTVDDAVWTALIQDYLGQDNFAVPDNRFLRNCGNEPLKWLGCATQDPVKNTRPPWRPNRRVELLFVKADKLPCKVPQPDTFDKPAPGAVGSSWCLGPGEDSKRACFVVPHLPPGGSPQNDEWVRTPAEPGTVIVRGSIKFEDGTPAADVKYLLIAPDGEFMNGEQSNGEGVAGRTKPDGTFEYPDKPKGIGVYTMEIQAPFVARTDDELPGAAKGNVVCKRLDGSSDFNVIVMPRPTSLEFVDAADVVAEVESARIGDSLRVRAEVPGSISDEITVEITVHAVRS
ncbi:MAG: peptidoglycan-binding protein, partial [Gammaproteobacteria bacterium]